MTIAMKCSGMYSILYIYLSPEVSMDVLALNGNLISSSSQVDVIDSKFELPPDRKKRFKVSLTIINFIFILVKKGSVESPSPGILHIISVLLAISN